MLHGKPGTGKSYLISALHNSLGGKCVLTAMTAFAANNIGGDTVHSALSPPAFQKQGSAWPPLKPDKLQEKQKLFEGKHLLVIDEISMCSSMTFEQLFKRLEEIKPENQGIVVLVVGDFAQLPPVNSGSLCKRGFSN